jgi:hypothetical protein
VLRSEPQPNFVAISVSTHPSASHPHLIELLNKMASVNNRITLQASRIAFINSVDAENDAGSIGALNLQAAQSKLEMLNETWEKFEAEHEKLLTSKTDVSKDLEYFKNDAYQTTMHVYVSGKAALRTRIADLESAHHPPTGAKLANSSLLAPTHARPALPGINIEPFSGDIRDWRPFQDLFVSLVGESPTLSNVEKMHYLTSSLRGNAARLIGNLPVCGDSFKTAWDLLTKRYENKRLLITAQLDKLFSLKRIENRSAKELNDLLNTTSEAVNALRALDSPVDQWDQLLVHLLVQKLDIRTREDWEFSLGTNTDFPSYEQLAQYLSACARAQESIEGYGTPRKPSAKTTQITPTQSSHQKGKPAHVHVAQQQKSESASSSNSSPSPDGSPVVSTDPKKNCACCSKPHFIVFCPIFRQYDSKERLDWVIQQHLCFNCLGPHNAYKCQSPHVCKKCNEKHHTMLHDSPFNTARRPPRSPPTQMQ